MRDLAEKEPWELSLGRSRARRRAAELRFVPAGTRAKRVSLGALAALTVGPTASLADGQAERPRRQRRTAEPPTTTEHTIVLSDGSEGRQVRLLQQALGAIKVDGVFGPETEAAVRAFQASRGLTVDGVVGPLTSAALRGQATARHATLSELRRPEPRRSGPPKAARSAACRGRRRRSPASDPAQNRRPRRAQEGPAAREAGQSATTGEHGEAKRDDRHVTRAPSSTGARGRRASRRRRGTSGRRSAAPESTDRGRGDAAAGRAARSRSTANSAPKPRPPSAGCRPATA